MEYQQMTVADITAELRDREIDRVYGRALSRCTKPELLSYLLSLGTTSDRHYSFSQVNMMLRCPRQYYYRYLLGLKVPPRGVMTLGGAVDVAESHNLSQKIESGRDEPVDAVLDVYHEDFRARREETDWQEDDPDALEKDGDVLVSLFHADVRGCVSVEPIEVQETTEISFGNAPYALLVIPDWVEKSGAMWDLKVKGRSPVEDEAARSLQLMLYDVGRTVKTGNPSPQVGIKALVRKKKPEIVERIATFEDAQRRRALRIVQQCVEVIRAGTFLPCSPDSWACTPAFCGYYDRCHQDL